MGNPLKKPEQEKLRCLVYQIEIITDSLEVGDRWEDHRKRLAATRLLRHIIREIWALLDLSP